MTIQRSAALGSHRVGLASRAALAVLAVACSTLIAAMPVSAATLERIKESGHIKLGYLVDARPFSARNAAGEAEGYGVSLCQQIAEQVKKQLALQSLTLDWVPVTVDNRFREVQQGRVDLLCSPANVTLTRRQEVSFSIPVFAGGNRAVLRADAPAALREALSDTPSTRPVWRGSPAAKLLENTSFAVVSGTTTQSWLQSRLKTFQIDAKITPVADYRAGLQQLLDRKVGVLFGDRALILGAMDDTAHKNLVIFDRLFTQEFAALALARGDEDFRLLVDRTLSELYASADFSKLYARWNGPVNDNTRVFLLWNTLPE